jgi:hypothetical protein
MVSASTAKFRQLQQQPTGQRTRIFSGGTRDGEGATWKSIRISGVAGTVSAQLASLEGIPRTDINANLRRALAAGRRVTALIREAAALRCGPTKLAPQEYSYYRLWGPNMPVTEKGRFVGKVRQRYKHNGCNSQAWYAAAADKILWHTLMVGTGLPVPDPLAVTQSGRQLPTPRP